MSDARSTPSRIAIIDDDPAFLDLMQDLLGVGEGYEVFTSPNWVGSFDFVSRVEPDLVILDLMLGRDQAGWAVLELLRSDPATRRLPVIMCSAAAPALDWRAQRMCDVSGVAFVSKPFDVDDLLQTIQDMLTGSSAAVAD
jgi:CheY-like chemotaxis protein